MASAQLQLPLDLQSPIRSAQSDRSQQSTSNTAASAKGTKLHVQELRTQQQIADVYELAKQFGADIEPSEPIDFDTLARSCLMILEDVERKYLNLFIAYDDEEPLGFLLGVTSPCLHRPRVVAEQKLWYVMPTARGGLAAKYLVMAYERWARLNGATQIYTGTANKLYAERTSKLLKHLGYARVGYLHVKDV